MVLIASTYSCKNCRLVIQDKSVIRGSWPWQWYHYKLRFHLQTKFKSDWAQGECIIGPCCHLCLSHSPLAALFWKCNMGNTWKGKNTNHHIFISLEFKLVRATAIQKLQDTHDYVCAIHIVWPYSHLFYNIKFCSEFFWDFDFFSDVFKGIFKKRCKAEYRNHKSIKSGFVNHGLLTLIIKAFYRSSKGSPPVKKNVFFRALPEKGWGGDPCPNFLTLFFHHVVPYILTSISCYVILFGHF